MYEIKINQLRFIMRKITKFNLLITFFVFGLVAMAQDDFHKISVGAELALPMGDFSNISSVGFGATGKHSMD